MIACWRSSRRHSQSGSRDSWEKCAVKAAGLQPVRFHCPPACARFLLGGTCDEVLLTVCGTQLGCGFGSYASVASDIGIEPHDFLAKLPIRFSGKCLHDIDYCSTPGNKGEPRDAGFAYRKWTCPLSARLTLLLSLTHSQLSGSERVNCSPAISPFSEETRPPRRSGA